MKIFIYRTCKEFSLAKRNGSYELSVLFLDGDHLKRSMMNWAIRPAMYLKQFADVFKGL